MERSSARIDGRTRTRPRGSRAGASPSAPRPGAGLDGSGTAGATAPTDPEGVAERSAARRTAARGRGASASWRESAAERSRETPRATGRSLAGAGAGPGPAGRASLRTDAPLGARGGGRSTIEGPAEARVARGVPARSAEGPSRPSSRTAGSTHTDGAGARRVGRVPPRPGTLTGWGTTDVDGGRSRARRAHAGPPSSAWTAGSLATTRPTGPIRPTGRGRSCAPARARTEVDPLPGSGGAWGSGPGGGPMPAGRTRRVASVARRAASVAGCGRAAGLGDGVGSAARGVPTSAERFKARSDHGSEDTSGSSSLATGAGSTQASSGALFRIRRGWRGASPRASAIRTAAAAAGRGR